jgi:hypothetical protein
MHFRSDKVGVDIFLCYRIIFLFLYFNRILKLFPSPFGIKWKPEIQEYILSLLNQILVFAGANKTDEAVCPCLLEEVKALQKEFMLDSLSQFPMILINLNRRNDR